jgi:peptidyl-prolyl cis-trans isomerase B (cyclophilin B)
MKKFITLFLPVLTVLALTACSPESSTPTKSSIESTTNTGSKPAATAPATETKTEAAASTSASTPAPAAGNPDEVAVIKTTEGTMVVEFWPDVAPKTVENFKKLAKEGFYNGTCFHRVIKGFMIQGGDPLTKDASKEAMWGTGDPGYKIKAEFNDRSHTKGVLSMARSQDPDSAGSQFFICHGNPTFLDHQYTAFGKLIKGEDVLDKIATTPTHPQDRPDKRMNIDSITIMPRAEAMKG